MFMSVAVCTHRAGALKRRVLLLSSPELAIGSRIVSRDNRIAASFISKAVQRRSSFLRGGKLNSAAIINKTRVARRVRISARYNFFVNAIKPLTPLLCDYRSAHVYSTVL